MQHLQPRADKAAAHAPGRRIGAPVVSMQDGETPVGARQRGDRAWPRRNICMQQANSFFYLILRLISFIPFACFFQDAAAAVECDVCK
jgi:hypothetical protein